MQSKLIITAAGAFGFGALVGWAITADRDDRLLRDKSRHILHLEERIDLLSQVHTHVVNINNGPVEPYVEAEDVDENQLEIPFEEESPMGNLQLVAPIEEVNGEEVDEPEEDPIPEGETPEQTKSKLQDLIDQYASSPEQRDEFVQLAEGDNSETQPFVISRDEYSWGEEGMEYAKITLNYYPHQRVLLDSDEEVVEDLQGTIGFRAISNFGGESGDPEVVFVRNPRLSSDFEVVRDMENEPPLHVKYGMPKEEFRLGKAAGTIRLRKEDE